MTSIMIYRFIVKTNEKAKLVLELAKLIFATYIAACVNISLYLTYTQLATKCEHFSSRRILGTYVKTYSDSKSSLNTIVCKIKISYQPQILSDYKESKL